jgi:hypothetical protein
LPEYIAELYRERFGKEQPDDIRPLEQILDEKKRQKAARKAEKKQVAESLSNPADLPFISSAKVEKPTD